MRQGTLAAALAGWNGLAIASGNAVLMERTFNADFLMHGADVSDLERFRYGTPVNPGQYDLEVHVNDRFLGRHDIAFYPGDDPFRAQACLPRALLLDAGLKPAYLDEDASGCVPLVARVAHAEAYFDTQALRLNLSVPQQAMENRVRGTVNASQWDPGVTAGMLDYDINLQRSGAGMAAYAGLSLGANHGAWRMRHRGTWYLREGLSSYQASHSYVQRDVVRWRSQVIAGQSITSGDLFEGIAFAGVQLTSDEQMVPDAVRGYAPVIRGIARSAATVTVSQGGYVIHEIRVASGPFQINDLYPSNYGGDLEVVIREADGSDQRFTVNFAAVPQALRQGMWRYSLAAGYRRPGDIRNKPANQMFAQGTWGRGMSNWLTLLAGAQGTTGYHAVLGGAAINTSIGAFGADLTHSQVAAQRGEPRTGNSVRLTYQRHMAGTGTNIVMSSHRYSSRQFVTLDEALRWRTEAGGDGGDGFTHRSKRRSQLDVSQRAGTRSSLFIRGSRVSYWGTSPAKTDYQIGFQSRWRQASWNVSAMRVRSSAGETLDQLQAGIEVPLGRAEQPSAIGVTVLQQQGGTGRHLSFNGRAPGEVPVDYGVAASWLADGTQSGNAGIQWQTPAARVGVAYAETGHDQRLNAGAAGAVVLHRAGVNVGPSLGSAFGIVQVEGGQGVRVGANGSRVGRNGYALLPSLTPYRWNEVTIASDGLPLDLALLQTSRRVAPTAGAAVALTFNTQHRQVAFAHVTHPNGAALTHFGSQVYGPSGEVVGVVGQGGVVHLHAALDGPVTVGTGNDTQCVIHFSQSDARNAEGQRWFQGICHESQAGGSP